MALTIRPPSGPRQGGGADNGRSAGQLAVRRAAVPLFEARGFEATTVDDIAEAAGISRRTFFRLFDGKHQIISCDHAVFHQEVVDHLRRHEWDRTAAQAGQALGLLLDSFTAAPADTKRRWQMVHSHTALYSEEIRWLERYRITIAVFLSDQPPPQTTIRSDMVAAALMAAVVAIVGHWVSDSTAVDPKALFADAIDWLVRTPLASESRKRIAVVETSLSIDEIVELLS